ncbi:MAG TPA: serine hydrolase domain-containing protein [Streptosporangiaceae bacterium]|jgi:CubicO group peptidase (beta-lactamase class C family)
MKANPAGAGLDERRLERITEHLQGRYIDQGRIAGAQLAVYRHGQVGYYREFGDRDRERSARVEEDTIWRIYSMTKPIVGVGLLALYEQGQFQLTDPVTRWLPEWSGLKVRQHGPDGSEQLTDARPMTVRDLMMHMSGLSRAGSAALRPGQAPGSPGRGNATLASMVERYADIPLEFQPGTQWLYTVSIDICGRLIEIMSGKPLDVYLRETVFEPLGMPDTAFYVPDDKAGRFAACYTRDAGKNLVLADDPQASGYRTEPTFFSGSGGLVSTMPDYLRFCQMLLNGGELDGVRVLGRKTVELMSLNHLPDGGDLQKYAMPGGYGEVGFPGMGFGLTVAVSKGPAATGVIGSAGEYMWGGAASTAFWVDPAEDLTVVFMTQLLPSGLFNFRGQLKALIYPSIVD